ncbi:hypothetical protein [Cellulomonas olei]|uniref:hypothetical protein n=1 Tax=Cellulomonas sp. P4 TaxID=3142533 RepID=UPI0031B9BA36
MDRQIASIDLQLPERWRVWRPGDGPRAARRAADELASGPVAGARLRAAVEAVDRAVLDLHTRHVRAGVWVPEPTGDVAASLACELLAESPEGPDAADTYLGRVRRKVYRSRRTTTRIAHHAASRSQVPAGAAVVALRSEGAARHEVVWTVFPPGARQAVQLRFDTRGSQRYPELLRHAESIATGMRVRFTAPARASAVAGPER